MDIKWDTKRHETIASALDLIIQKRQGSWPSDEVRNKMRTMTCCTIGSPFYEDTFGVKINEQEFVFDVHARMNNSKIYRPMAFLYVCDAAGVCSKHQIQYRGSEQKGFWPNVEQTKIMWKRVQ
jgi:hypothetical protein